MEEQPHEEESLRDQKIVFEEPIHRQSYQIKALVGKIWCTQKKSIGTLLCQILTPLLCLLFTTAVTMIVKNNLSTKIAKPAFPQPFNIPGTFSNKPQFQTTCDQFYFYTSNGTFGKSPQSLLQNAATKYCSNVNDIRPKFYHKNSTNQMNDQVLTFLKKSDDPSNSSDEDAAAGIPDGMMTYNHISSSNLSITLAVNDMRIGRYHRSNGITRLLLNQKDDDSSMINSYLRVTEGAMSLIDLVTKTYLNSYIQSQKLSSSFMYMPFKEENSFALRCINVIGNSLNPMAISLLIPMMLYFLVNQRQSRLLQMMKMNGLNMKYYWLINYLFYTILSLITFSVFYVFGAFVFRIELFISTSPVIFCILFFGWAISQVSLSSFIQLFVSKSKSALIVGYSIAIFATLIGQILSSMIFPFPSRLPTWMFLFPPFALSRVFYLMSFSCANNSCYSSIHSISSEMILGLTTIYVSTLIFPLTILISDLYDNFSQKINICKKKPQQEFLSKTKVFQDETVQKQNQVITRLLKEQLYPPLIVNNVAKQYQCQNGFKNNFALKSTSISVSENQILGLLGPSGSGKTTLMSLIAGSNNITTGNLLFDGRIPQQNSNKLIGVCPQFDLLWPELSPKQHLIFYSRLKGVQESEIESTVSEMLENVDLTDWKNKRVSSLSGGMKRRLSIAIALSGYPRIVLLDEPASGLDPQHRRQLWDIILKSRKDKAILLTTHSLQQAQVLCNRVGILITGTLRCLGKIPDLKIRLGKGYNLSINMKKSPKQQQIQSFNILQKSIQTLQQTIFQNNISFLQKHQFHRTVNYYIDRNQSNLGKLFQLLIQNKDQLNIQDWALQQPSLYDVFTRLVDESELDQ